MIKAIIFDIGGVIISPEIEKINNIIADYFGIEYPQFNDFIKKYKLDLTKGKISLIKVYSKLTEQFGLKRLSAQDIVNKHLEIYQKIISNLNEGVISIIKRLKKKYLIVCLVNAELDVIPLAKKGGLYDYFNRTYISTELGMKKPDAEIYLTVLKDLGLTPKEVIFIDDKEENVNAAKRMSINGIHYKYGDDLEKELAVFSVKID